MTREQKALKLVERMALFDMCLNDTGHFFDRAREIVDGPDYEEPTSQTVILERSP